VVFAAQINGHREDRFGSKTAAMVDKPELQCATALCVAGGTRSFGKKNGCDANDMFRWADVAKTEHADLPSRWEEASFIPASKVRSMEVAPSFVTRSQDWVCAYSRALAFALFLIFLLPTPQTFAARLGGAYYVDDAEIGKVGSCEIESWSSFAATGDRIAVFSPACVFNSGQPVELGTNLVNLRSDGERDSLGTLTAKIVPIPIGRKGFGVAIAGAVVYDPLTRTGNGLILNVPVTFDFSKQLRVNVNFGGQYYSGGDPHGLFATAGAGVSWNFVPQWSVISELFALIGPGQSNPRFQSGVRYSPMKDIDWDLIYGRNLTGEGANWITVGLTVRIGDN
jgi:hypothetical protein